MNKHNDNPPTQHPTIRRTDGKTPTCHSNNLFTDLFGCFFGHSWDKWKILESKEFGYTYWRLSQSRQCKICNKTQIKTSIK
jgi:hypothetical protein